MKHSCGFAKRRKDLRQFTGFLILLGFFFFGCTSDNGDDRSTFSGRYEVEEYSQITYAQRPEYEVVIRIDRGTEDQVIISNFYDMDMDVSAHVDGRSFIVPPQVHNFYEVEGDGVLSGNVITMQYKVSSVLEDHDFFDRLNAELTLIE